MRIPPHISFAIDRLPAPFKKLRGSHYLKESAGVQRSRTLDCLQASQEKTAIPRLSPHLHELRIRSSRAATAHTFVLLDGDGVPLRNWGRTRYRQAFDFGAQDLAALWRTSVQKLDSLQPNQGGQNRGNFTDLPRPRLTGAVCCRRLRRTAPFPSEHSKAHRESGSSARGPDRRRASTSKREGSTRPAPRGSAAEAAPWILAISSQETTPATVRPPHRQSYPPC